MHPLLDKYFAGTITDSEKSSLFQALDGDEALKAEFARLQSAVALSGLMHKDTDAQTARTALNELHLTTRRRKAKRVALTVLKYAAVAVVTSGLWLAFLSRTDDPEPIAGSTRIEVPKGQTIHITLPDGTETWLSSRTRLIIPSRFNQEDRIIELDGEGFFAVSKNEKKPFTVKTKQYDIQVTGTHFNVFAYSESPLFKTDLIEGSVSVYNKSNKNNIVHLAPKETASLKDGELVKIQSTFSYSHYIMNGIYYFENTSFKEIADCLELWYNVKIHLRKPEIAAYVFSGKFRQSDNIELILQAIKETGKFNYKLIDEYEIEIY
jgi:ferric-dicitrate binding protein FerR (iron transport regulator)